MGYETWYWRIYNLLWRLFALMAMLAGVTLVCTAVLEMMGRMRPWYGAAAWAFALLGVVLTFVGVMLCRLRTYRPDLGDVSWWAGKAGGYVAGAPQSGTPRSWWTGDSKRERLRSLQRQDDG